MSIRLSVTFESVCPSPASFYIATLCCFSFTEGQQLYKLGIRIEDLGLRINIRDRGIGIVDCGLGLGIGIWDWDLGLGIGNWELGLGIGN